jgi:SAM-dependent methyltransferase
MVGTGPFPLFKFTEFPFLSGTSCSGRRIKRQPNGRMWSTFFLEPVFVVNRVGVSQHEGFVQGWEVELTKPRFNFQIARSGLSIRVAISNSSGAEVASAMVGGKRGAIEIQNISIEPGESTCAYDLIAGAVKEFLLLKGQGRVLLRGVKDPRVKRVAQEMFGNKLIMARKGFGRSLNGPWKDAIDPSSEEFHRLLEDPTALVDLAGTLTPEARQALWPNEDLPSLELGATVSLAQKVVFTPSTDEALRRAYSDFSALESDLYEILVGDQKVGGIIFSETSKKLFLKTIKIDDSVQGNGIGKIVFRALAKRATLILSPELNLAGHPVPFEGRSVKNPAAFSIMKGIYKTGTMEAVPLGTKYQTDEDEPVSSWDNALKEGTPAFEQLTGPANIGENGEYKILFHLRGVIANEIEDESARETLREQWVADKELYSRGATPLNSFALLGGGFPFDPLIGLTVAAIFLVAMFFKDEILKWLEGRAPPPVQDFVNKFVPSFKFPQETVQRMVEKLIASPLTIPLRFSIIPGESELSAGHSLFSSEKRLPPFDPRPVNNGLLAEPYARYAESVSISRKGIGFLIVLFDGRGQEIGKATTFGKRGEITVTDIEIRTNEKGAGLALLSQVAQFGLFPGGVGRILIRRTNNSEIMKAAVDLFDAESLLVAPHRFDRVVKNSYWNDQISPELDEAFFEKMERSSNSMDVSGVLSKEKRRTLWPGGRGFPGVVEMKAEGFRSVSLDSKDKMFDVRDENGTPVGRAICSLNSTSLVLKWIDSSSQGGGWGKASLLAVAMEASRILMPELNRNGRPVPLVVENIMDPRTAHILMKYIFKPGTMEALPSQNAFSLIGSGSPVNWNNGISEKDPRFQLLVRPPAGAEWRQYHLRGELQDPIYAWAESRFQSRQLTNSFYFLPLGTPFDPILGLTVAAIFLGAMLFKGEILNWLKGRVPPGVYVFANSAIPDLSSFRPRIVRVFTQVLGFLIEQIVEIVGRLFGMAELQVPVALGIIPQDGKTTEFISRGPSSRLDDIVKAMDSSDIQGIYEHLAHYFGLWGVAADVGSSSYDLPAKGLLAGGMKKVSLVDDLHHEQKTISPGIDVFPGDATNLSNRFGEKTLDAIVFHRSLHHIVADKESRGSGAGQLLIEAGSSPDDIFFHIDLLSRVMDETFKTLKPGGRVLLYFDAHTFRLPGPPGFFGWSLEDMLAEKGFEDVSLITSKNGTVLATGVRPNRSLGYTFSGGIGVSRLSVNDTLDEADREVFSKALGAISPTVFDMQGVDVLIDPRRVALERNPVEELKNKMGVSSGAVGKMSPEKVEGIIQQDPASIHWVRGFSSKPNGVNSLAETCVESARKGDPNASGAALAAWDDSKLLAGPNPEIVANLLAVLIGDKKDQADGLTDQFAEAYNRVRAGLLLSKLLSGTLMKTSTGSELQSGIILNISALFDQQAEDTAKNNTWLALAAALSVRERNPNVPLGLVVHGVNVNEQIVTDTLSQSVPRWANFMTDGVSLFVQGNTVGKTVFVNEKFSLKALRINPLWDRPLNLLGLSVEAIAESIDQDKSVDLIPLDVFVNKQLQQVLQQVRFILRNA